MAVTAHYATRGANGMPELRARLIAFRKIDGEHTGSNMASYLARILFELGVLKKLGQFTLDNASNNDTMMRHLELAVQKFDSSVTLPEEEHRCR